ncbi:MAG: sensor histidine kinase [Thermoguttaceae bacterium]
MTCHSIRFKMLVILGILLLLATLLASAGLYTVHLYKMQSRDVVWRASVLPVAAILSGCVGQLRADLGELRGIRRIRPRISAMDKRDDRLLLETSFQKSLFKIQQTNDEYRELLRIRVAESGNDQSIHQESDSVGEIRLVVQSLQDIVLQSDWGADDATLEIMEERLGALQQVTDQLPRLLHEKLKANSQTMREQSRWLLATLLIAISIAVFLIILLVRLSCIWIFRPINILVAGSRMIAEGRFQHRIELPTQDEMRELAEAFNQMTERFENVRHDLDSQVRLKSSELVRSERLASVGFLAAGVAHEINNPLMSISTCAESLQRRLFPILLESHDKIKNENNNQLKMEEDSELLHENNNKNNNYNNNETKIQQSEETSSLENFPCLTQKDAKYLARYLKMIQDEAFRCKEITEKLLNFARSDQLVRERIDFVPIIQDMIEMTRQHGAFKHKRIQIELPKSLELVAHSQELKQVVLNLLTNALSVSPPDGLVSIQLSSENNEALLSVRDNGVGMDTETLKNVFEPFFTRRPHGEGTGLGLSITHRIVTEHGGIIEAFSDGPGKGALFVVHLPLNESPVKNSKELKPSNNTPHF